MNTQLISLLTLCILLGPGIRSSPTIPFENGIPYPW